MKVVPHHEVEWRGIAGVVFSVVMDEFCEGKVFDPCFRVVVTIDPEIRF
jgi:hypothetical protein